jgi:hypothetical protein
MTTRYEPDNPGQQTRSHDGYDDGVDEAASSREPEQAHYFPTDQGTGYSENDVPQRPIAVTGHDLSCGPTRDPARNNPSYPMHSSPLVEEFQDWKSSLETRLP